MPATYMLRQHQRALDTMDTPEAARDRKIRMDASKRANEARLRRFKILTTDNFEEASEFYRTRYERWVKILTARELSKTGE